MLAAVVLLSPLALDLVFFPDDRGVFAFLLGMLGAVFVGRKSSALKTPREAHRARWLAVSAVPIGLGLGLCLFGFWYWQTDPVDAIEIVWHASVFCGFGVFAGIVARAVVLFLGQKDLPQSHAGPDTPLGRGDM